MLLLVPADPLNPRRADEHFRREATAARNLGIPVAYIDHDALARPAAGPAAVAGVPADSDAIYRGWMLNADQYETFAQLLNQRDVVLRTDPSRYRKAHELPGWALTLQPVTAETVWTVGADLSAFEQACIRLERGPAVLRDYTKSLKHHWDEAMFIADVSDLPKARRTATRFLDLRGEDFAGGLVLRRFETFVGPELRTWWIDGRLELVTNHPDTADDAPAVVPKLQRVAPLVAALELRFVTVDVTRHRDGTWWVIELGDGQVSDLPRSTDPERLLHALALGTAAPRY